MGWLRHGTLAIGTAAAETRLLSMDDQLGLAGADAFSPNVRAKHVTAREVAFLKRATVKDVYYCFRLLLGRYPHPEEWRGHAMRAGEDLRGVVRSFASSLECARSGLLDSQQDIRPAVATFEGMRVYTDENDASIGQAVRDGYYEPEVCTVLRSFLRPGMGVLDLGANIGVLALLAAQLVGPAGTVIAVEPNARNVRLMEASRRANAFRHLSIFQVAAARENSLLVLNTSYSNGTTSGLPAAEAALMRAETVPAFRIDGLVTASQRIDLIKIDVEGAEYAALMGCEGILRRDRPIIISEFSPDLMPGISGISGPDYLRWLIGIGYSLAVIEPDGLLQDMAQDVAGIMRIYNSRMTDHVDIVAQPRR